MKYPKLVLLLATFVAAYVLHYFGAFVPLEKTLNGNGYWSMLLAGALFSFGFTSAFGLAILIDMATQVHPVLGALVGGIGGMIADICLFSLMRFTVFHEEIHRLRNSRLIQILFDMIHHSSISERLRRTILLTFAGLIIASPFPDEFGVTLVSSLTSVRSKEFAFLSFVLSTLGIFFILLIAQ